MALTKKHALGRKERTQGLSRLPTDAVSVFLLDYFTEVAKETGNASRVKFQLLLKEYIMSHRVCEFEPFRITKTEL